ncbi:Cytochrome P450 704C1 [Frankliniella fusca]|uniref:Cytochrome P450 704C1 n=1 Tax=Frankliniella fusca TaxID=407009 RepID=A0AAE1LQM9_9NEOP|nr:Cytochrome P450 704C1 [Frankliniella fusca]
MEPYCNCKSQYVSDRLLEEKSSSQNSVNSFATECFSLECIRQNTSKDILELYLRILRILCWLQKLPSEMLSVMRGNKNCGNENIKWQRYNLKSL